MPNDGHDKTAAALRIYEYVDPDGVVFYSFTKLAGTSIRKLMLANHMGQHYRRHISDIHNLAIQRQLLERD